MKPLKKFTKALLSISNSHFVSAGDGVLSRVRRGHHRGSQGAAQGGRDLGHLRWLFGRTVLPPLPEPSKLLLSIQLHLSISIRRLKINCSY